VPDNHYDERIAATYDAAAADHFDPAVLDPTVDLLAGLAGDGAALELAIGSGRVALPLRERGVPVHGIELSPAMVERLRAKPGAEAIEVTIGDMTTTRVEGRFRLAYLVYNTINNVLTQEEQVACFRNAAAHLEPGGCFVVEVGVPQLRRLSPGERIVAYDVSPEHLGFDEYTDLTERQSFSSHHYWPKDGRVEIFSVPFRFVWPSELDLMAQLAGMTLRERWSSWTREPFTGESRSHISVWELPG
jgi:SAM-dependent methyltransferase